MRKLLSLLLCLALLLPIMGCSQEESPEKPVNFYYRRAEIGYTDDMGVISREQRESAGYEEDVRQLLSVYFDGPVSTELQQLFPEDLAVISLHYAGNTAKITLSYHLGQLHGIDLTVACACLTMTVIELTGVDSVQIFAAGTLLDEYQSITMDKDCFLLLDTSKDAKKG